MLIRKINKTKWLQYDIINGADVSADALTNCIKTYNNSLSVWEIKDETDLEEAVLAIVAGQDYLEAIDVIILDERHFVKCQINQESTEGRTPVNDLKNIHKDLCNLDFWTLGMVAENIVESFKTDKVKRYTISKLKDILKKAIEQNRLQVGDLNENIQRKLA